MKRYKAYKCSDCREACFSLSTEMPVCCLHDEVAVYWEEVPIETINEVVTNED